MANSLVITDMLPALLDRILPAITQLQRLEGRPRTRQFDGALKADVRDPLWMLTRQWQMGELQGDDAASPFFAKMHLQSSPLTKYRADHQPIEEFEPTVPLEAKVERVPLTHPHHKHDFSLDLRLLMGRQWKKLLGDLVDYYPQFLTQYPIDPPTAHDASVRSHMVVDQAFRAVVGRAMDGSKLYRYLTADPTHQPYDGLTVAQLDKPSLEERGQRFVAWFRRLFYQPAPDSNQAWDKARLEYRCATAAPSSEGEKVFVADEYYHGVLDWYNFNISKDVADGLGADTDPLPAAKTSTVIPTPVQFSSMPNTRWWEFEDRQTNFGDVTAATTDLAKLLFLEFSLIYANDWFVIPATIPAGSIANIHGLVVSNVFDEHIWIDRAGAGIDNQWQRWDMFTLNQKNSLNHDTDPTLLVLPTLPRILESKPVEEVHFLRDEASNMVWAVERIAQAPDGVSRPASELAAEALEFYRRELGDSLKRAQTLNYNADVRYQVMNSVPENWIPFIPVHMPNNDVRQIQLQRARLPRFFGGEVDPSKIASLPVEQRFVLPQTMLLHHGLEMQPTQQYFIHEEEVTRSGIRVIKTFQRARWRNGQVIVWLGIRKQVGRGEGYSGLAFDEVVNTRTA